MVFITALADMFAGNILTGFSRSILNLAMLCMSRGEKMSRHEMTLYYFWLMVYFSSIQRRDLPTVYYAYLTCDFYY